VAVPGFYLTVLFILYRFSKLFKREPSYQFKVQHEASSSSLMAAIKGELETFKQQLHKEASEKPVAVKETVAPQAVQQLLRDIQQLSKAQSEFQLEMIESHKDLWKALSCLQIKVEQTEQHSAPLSNGLLSREPKEPFPSLVTFESNIDDYKIEEISHNASFGSSITPSMTFSVREETEKGDADEVSPKNSRKSSMNARYPETTDIPSFDDGPNFYPHKSEPRPEPRTEPKVEPKAEPKVEQPVFKQPQPAVPQNPQPHVQTLPIQPVEPVNSEAEPKAEPPVNSGLKSKFQARREKVVQDSTKPESRAKFVPPPAAKNPFGL